MCLAATSFHRVVTRVMQCGLTVAGQCLCGVDNSRIFVPAPTLRHRPWSFRHTHPSFLRKLISKRFTMNGMTDSSSNQTPGADPISESSNDRPNSLRPTHRLEQLKVGERGVQLLVSTHDHLYDAKNVEGGNNSFQCVGGWNDTSIHELGQMLISHQNNMSRSNDTVSRVSAFKGPGHTMKSSTQEPSSQS